MRIESIDDVANASYPRGFKKPEAYSFGETCEHDPEHTDCLYASPRRPTWFGFGSSISEDFDLLDATAHTFVIGTTTPLPLEDLDAIELRPLCVRTKALTIRRAWDKTSPLAAMHAGREHVKVLTTSPGSDYGLWTFDRHGPMSRHLYTDTDTGMASVTRAIMSMCGDGSRDDWRFTPVSLASTLLDRWLDSDDHTLIAADGFPTDAIRAAA